MILKNTLEIIPLVIIYSALYLIANKFQLFPVANVPKVSLDLLFEFNQHWVWVYLSSYLSIPTMYILYFYRIRKIFTLNFMLLTVLSFLIFMFYPTSVDRSIIHYENMNYLYKFVFKLLHSADSPTNCIPSLHVSTAGIIFFLFIDQKEFKYSILSFVYVILVGLSTMFIKQHYFLDVLTGFLMAFIVYIIYIGANSYARKKMG
jgi:membrane-associated phospholipid phosphatase